MASTPNSYYSSSPSPSPSPSRQSTPEWLRDDSPEGGRVYTPGLYSVESEDEMPDLAAPPLTEEDEDAFHSPPPPKTTTLPPPRRSVMEKRFAKMKKIGEKVGPENVALAWIFVGIESRKSPAAQTLRTGFNLKPTLSEVLELSKELYTEYDQAVKSLRNHGGFQGRVSNLCLANFLRDMMEIPNLAMIRMRRILAECKCCEKHQSCRPVCQEMKRLPGYDIFRAQIPGWDDCKCTCRSLSRQLERALTGELPLEVNGQLWERTNSSS